MTTLCRLQDMVTDSSKERVLCEEQTDGSFLGPPLALVSRPGGEGSVAFGCLDATLKSRVSAASVFLEIT